MEDARIVIISLLLAYMFSYLFGSLLQYQFKLKRNTFII